MAKKKKVSMVYMGKRFDGKMLSDKFHGDDPEDQFSFRTKKAMYFIIGHKYEVETEGETFLLGAAKLIEQVSMSKEIRQWSMEDTAARKEKEVIKAIAKMTKENLEAWKKCMEPIRYAMLNASRIQRSAIKLKVMALLEEWG